MSRFVRHVSVALVSLLVLVGLGAYVLAPPATALELRAVTSASAEAPSVSGLVRDLDGQPIRSGSVVLQAFDGSGNPAETRSLALATDGTFRFDVTSTSGADTRFRLDVTTSSASGARTFTLAAGTSVRFDVRLVQRSRFSVAPMFGY